MSFYRLTLIALSLCIVPLWGAQAEKPNFILINIDDLGYADIGPFGGEVATPNLDQMAREGRKFTSHYAAPVCSPSRASMMTGCYPKRVLPIPHVLFPAGEVGLNPDELTVAEVLKEAGYATGMVGKWHLGDQAEFLPNKQGFDEYYGLPYSNDMGPVADGAKSNPGEPEPQSQPKNNGKGKKAAGQPKRVMQPDDEQGIRANQPPLPLLENGQVIERVKQAEQHTLTRRYTERAKAFIHEKKDVPFFLYLPHTAVHFPLYPGKEFVGKSGAGLYQDWVQEVDWSVGQILDAVRELKLDRQTLVIFTSDNGGATRHGANNSPLRGAKASTWEGGVRVCTIAWWPGRVPAGTSANGVTSHMDFLPTFAALAGGKVNNGKRLDGHDISKLLLNAEAGASPYEAFYFYRGLKLEAVRSGPWKLHLGSGELYDLDHDLSEATNVAAGHEAEVKKLRDLAAAMDGDLGMDGIGPGVRPLGRVAKAQPLIGLDGKVREDAAKKSKQLD